MPALTGEPARRALSVLRVLRDSGHAAYVAGGAVRDLLLGRPPGDVDIATSATPAEVRALFDRVVPVGEEFGVVLVVVEDLPIEVATFRRDFDYADGRRPARVVFGTRPEEDAARRDFTVNGLFLDPFDGDRVLDFVGGRADLAARVIRAIGDPRQRFEEDRLRMLRAVRFACVLGFTLDPATAGAVMERAADIASVSGERIRDEILGILAGPDPREGLALLRATGLLRVILPEVDALAGVPQPANFHPEGDVFTHTALALHHLSPRTPTLCLAALLHDIGKPATLAVADRIRFNGHAALGAEMAGEVCRRLRLSRRDTEAVVELVAGHLRFLDVERMREARLRRFLTGPLAEDHLALHRADCLASLGDLSRYEFCVRRRAEFLSAPPPPDRLLTGHDLKGLGLLPGPEFAQILAEVDDRRLEGRLRTRREALDYVRRRLAGEEEE